MTLAPKAPAPLDAIYTADETAERLRLTPRAIIKLRRQNGACSQISRHYLFSEQDLLDIWKAMRAPPIAYKGRAVAESLSEQFLSKRAGQEIQKTLGLARIGDTIAMQASSHSRQSGTMINSTDEETEECRLERLAEAAQEREQIVEELVHWFAPGTYGCHAALQMASVFMDSVDRHLAEHPAVLSNPEWYRLATRAQEALFNLYQEIGAVHLDATPD